MSTKQLAATSGLVCVLLLLWLCVQQLSTHLRQHKHNDNHRHTGGDVFITVSNWVLLDVA